MKSKDLNATEAIKEVKKFSSVTDLRAFAKGDARKTVIDAVDSKAISIKNQRAAKPATEKTSEKKSTPKR